MRRLAALGVTHDHGSVPDVASIRPMELLGERVIPVVAGSDAGLSLGAGAAGGGTAWLRSGAMAASPQPVLSPLTAPAIFLVATIDPGGEAAVGDLLSDLAGLQRAVGFRVPDGGLTCVAGIGSLAWDRLFAGPRPAELHPFRQVCG